MILGIYCAGGLGRDVLELAKQQVDFSFFVFIDDSLAGNEVNGFPVYDFVSFCTQYSPAVAQVIVACGEPTLLLQLTERVRNAGYSLRSLVHPGVHVPISAEIGEGVVVQQNVFLGPNCILKNGCYLNVNCGIGHGAEIGCAANVSMGCMLAGNSIIGDGSYIGAGTIVRDEIKIGTNCIIGMGSLVTHDIPDGMVAYGAPCKVVRPNTNGIVFH